MPLTKQLKEKIFHLDAGERTKLVKELLESLEPDSPDNNNGVQSSWIREAQKRYIAWKNGNVTTVPEEEANERIKKRLQ